MFDQYSVEIELTRPQLATNPCSPEIMDRHILGRQRKLIMDKSKINTAINKYLEAIQISQQKGQQEVDKVFERLQEMTGVIFTDEDKEKMLAGDLSSMKETFAELETTGTTIFFWDQKTDKPCIGDHMILGFLKASVEAIGRTKREKAKATVFGSISWTQALINQHVSIVERFIPFDTDITRDDKGNPVYLQRSLRAMTAQGPRVTLAKSEQVPEGAKLKFTMNVMPDSPLEKKHFEEMFAYGQMKGLGQWRSAGYGRHITKLHKIK